jgi:glycosyltransferase involved in cell wall biosynthesis
VDKPSPPGRLPISVVIPAFNRQDYVVACIESAASQTAAPQEILVIDDGSTDETGTIARRLGATVIRQANAGVSAARNTGIKAASAPWIAFLDTDDVWLPEKLEMQWEALALCPRAGIAFCDFSQFNDGGTIVESTLPTYKSYAAVKRRETAPGLFCCDHGSLCDAFTQANFMLTSSLVIRRDLLLSVGLFDVELRHREDYELLLRLVTVSTAAAVERPLVRYRHHGENASKEWMPMLLGRALIADRVIRSPAQYPSAALERFARIQHLQLRQIGAKWLAAGEFESAADAFAKSLARKFSLAALLGYATASILRFTGGVYAYRALRAFRRRLRSSP